MIIITMVMSIEKAKLTSGNRERYLATRSLRYESFSFLTWRLQIEIMVCLSMKFTNYCTNHHDSLCL